MGEMKLDRLNRKEPSKVERPEVSEVITARKQFVKTSKTTWYESDNYWHLVNNKLGVKVQSVLKTAVIEVR